jgi:hypothetical protein
MRIQVVEARLLPGEVCGFLVRGDREQAEEELRRLLRDWPGSLVERGGRRIPVHTIDPFSIVVRREAEPGGARAGSGPPRYAIDGTLVDGSGIR